MPGILLLALIILPIAELWLLVRIGQAIGLGPTIALILLTGIFGVSIARRGGARALFRIQDSLARGALPAREVIDGLMIFLAGALLVVPGVITDGLGLLLLIPPLRARAARLLGDYFRARLVVAGPGGHMRVGGLGPDFFSRAARPSSADDIIDVPCRDVTDEHSRRLED